MKKLLLFAVIAIGLASCGCPDDSAPHKFAVGQDVHIKHKLSHSDATVTQLLLQLYVRGELLFHIECETPPYRHRG